MHCSYWNLKGYLMSHVNDNWYSMDDFAMIRAEEEDKEIKIRKQCDALANITRY